MAHEAEGAPSRQEQWKRRSLRGCNADFRKYATFALEASVVGWFQHHAPERAENLLRRLHVLCGGHQKTSTQPFRRHIPHVCTLDRSAPRSRSSVVHARHPGRSGGAYPLRRTIFPKCEREPDPHLGTKRAFTCERGSHVYGCVLLLAIVAGRGSRHSTYGSS